MRHLFLLPKNPTKLKVRMIRNECSMIQQLVEVKIMINI